MFVLGHGPANILRLWKKLEGLVVGGGGAILRSWKEHCQLDYKRWFFTLRNSLCEPFLFFLREEWL